jgi:hypothetical protein
MPTNVTAEYMDGRKTYQRPQAILLSDNPGTLVNGYYIPTGIEKGSNSSQDGSFIILSDDNRSPLNFTTSRIEKRERMINGRMRSYHIADKLTMSTSWDMLPSRSYSSSPEFDTTTGQSALAGRASAEFTTDGGAGGVELLNWYENHKGSFWVFLAYDKYTNFENLEGISDPYANLQKYNQVIEVFISNFDYSVQKRGGTNFDFWSVSLSLEEV